jgi:thioesterase domain-containing protein
LPEDDGDKRMTRLAQIAFGKEVMRRVTDVILPLNDCGSGPAFYCVHSVMGAATDFRHMARMLGSQQKFFGIQVPTSKRNAEFAGSIEAISRFYVEHLVKFQPSGSLILGGHSVGAVIALEMAQQLHALGRDVDLLVVFDGEIFNTKTEFSARHPLYLLKLIWNLPSWIREYLLVEFTFRSFCQTVLHKVRAAVKKAAAKLRGGGIGAGHAVEGFINLRNATPDHAAFMKVLYETQFGYVPRSYPGRILVCIAKTQPLAYLRQIAAPWRSIAPHAEIRWFAGTHTSMLRAPRGLPIAEVLKQRIAEIESSSDLAEAVARNATL